MKSQLLYALMILMALNACTHTAKINHVSNIDTIIIENIFPYQAKHCHASTITELPGGDLLAAWFYGSGERTSDDVAILGSRYNHLTREWEKPFEMADVRGFPDINPVLFVDNDSRLWLVWYTVMAYQWESSVLKYRISSDYEKPGPPAWLWQDVIHVKADGSSPDGIGKDDPYVKKLAEKYNDYISKMLQGNEEKGTREMWNKAIEHYLDIARGTGFMRNGTDTGEDGKRFRTTLGYPLMRRIGWQTRNKPLISGNTIVIPLYSDGFDHSIMAITKNGGKDWQFSEPVVGAGNVQPALALCRDSSVTAYMRDNGPAPQRLMKSLSHDQGMTWSTVEDTEIPNPGSGADIAVLRSGSWALVSNDLEEGRYRLSVWLSEDEGKSWPYRKPIIDGKPGSQERAHYPAVIQDSEGLIHVSFTNQEADTLKTISHACFSEGWIKKGL